MSNKNFLCAFRNGDRCFLNFHDYFRHITLYHASERNFRLTCDISSSCGIMYKTFTSYKMHVHRQHQSLLNATAHQPKVNDVQGFNQLSTQTQITPVTNSIAIDDSNADIIYNDNENDGFNSLWNDLSVDNLYQHKSIDLMTIQEQYTRFLLELREHHILPQNVIQSITTHIVKLLNSIMNLLEEQANKKNESKESATTAKTIAVNDMCSTIKNIEQSIIMSTRNEYQFLQSCKKFFNYTPPIENILSSNEERKEYSYHISIKESLKKILQKQDMIPLLTENIRNQYCATKANMDLMFSCRDGLIGKKIRNNSFMIQLYIDGIGVTNPIGPKKDRHKLTMVYFTLEDVPDVFQSMLECINLAAICQTKYLNSSEKIKRFYSHIVNDLNDLQQFGLAINTFNSQVLFSFSTVAGDNLAVHEMAGFQQSFSSGYFCRRCLVTYENRLIPLTDVHFIQRTSKEHERFLQLMQRRPNVKSCFGVVQPSPLNNLLNFDPTNCFPGDIMYDFFEGNYH